MGITGLLTLLDGASTGVHVDQLSGSVCVIDGNSWLHRAAYGCAQVLYEGQDTDKYVLYCLKRCQMLIDARIKPVVVFDGQSLPAKEITHRERQSVRHNTRQKIELLLADNKRSKAFDLMRSCIEVTPQMIKRLMDALRDNGIDFLVSPYEADPQMAYLVNNGFADFAVSEDSDLLVYDCRFCLFKLDAKTGCGRLMNVSLIKDCLGSSFDANKLRHMSILSGCDYLPNLPGIGLQRAKKFFKMTANSDLKTVLYKIPNYLNLNKKVKITRDYVNDFIKADNTFKYQLVFCPKRRQLVPLTPYESGIRSVDVTYAGTPFDPQLGEDFAFQYAIGNVDTKTLQVIDSYSFEPKCDSIWSKDWLNYKETITTNDIILGKTNPFAAINSSQISDSDNKDIEIMPFKTRSQNTRVNEDSEHDSDKPRKRLKVEENQFVNCRQLMSEYSSSSTNSPIKRSPVLSSCTKSAYTSTKSIYSRNIFKVSKEVSDASEESVTQSKYFSNIDRQKKPSDEQTVDHRNQLTAKVIYGESSQYSLNSSGNTLLDTSFDETFTQSDAERSEISETSEDEISLLSCFTAIKSKSANSSIAKRRSNPLNSTFISPSNKSDIRSYFNS